jgi:hypothetical protein
VRVNPGASLRVRGAVEIGDEGAFRRDWADEEGTAGPVPVPVLIEGEGRLWIKAKSFWFV